VKFEQKRRHPRYEVPYTVAECVLSRDEREINFIGLICNYSKGGVCIHTAHALDTGQTISIESKDPKLSETAIVRWFKDESAYSYRVGLEFI
jgi:hypothetical protein